MKPQILMQDGGKTLELRIYSEIGETFWGDGVSAQSVGRALDDHPDVENINVRLNSPGGHVFDGAAIYNQLRRHPAHVTVDIDGLAASAASVIAMAGDTINIADNAFIMIHEAMSLTSGDAGEHERTAALLRQTTSSMADTYARRTGLEKTQLLEMMAAETWMNASDSVAKGFAHHITDGTDVVNTYDFSHYPYKRAPAHLRFKNTARAPQPAIEPDTGHDMPTDPAKLVGDHVESDIDIDSVAMRAAEIVQNRQASDSDRRKEFTKLCVNAAGRFGRERATEMRTSANGDPLALDELIQMEAVLEATPTSTPTPAPSTTRVEGGDSNHHQALDDFAVVALARGLPNNWDNPYQAEAKKRGLDERTPAFSMLIKAAISMGLDTSRAHDGAAHREAIVRQMRQSRSTRYESIKNGIRYVSNSLGGGLVPADLESVYLDVPRKSLDLGYEREALPLDTIARRENLEDFRDKTFVKFDLAADWKKLASGADLSQFRHIDSRYTFKADQYGGLLLVDDTAIVNDDLGALTRVPAEIGAYVASEESQIVVDGIQTGFTGGYTGIHDNPVADPQDFDAFLDTLRKAALGDNVVKDDKAMLKAAEKLSKTRALVPTATMYGPALRKKWIEYGTPVSSAQGAGIDQRSNIVRGEFERTLFTNSFEAIQMATSDVRSYYWPTGLQNPLVWGRVAGRERRLDIGEAPMERVPGMLIRITSTFGFAVTQDFVFEVSQAP